MEPRRTSSSGRTNTPQSVFESGYSASRAAAMEEKSDRAWSRVTSGLSRPSARRKWDPRAVYQYGSGLRGRIRSVAPVEKGCQFSEKYPHHGVHSAVQDHGPPQDVGIPSEGPLPEAVGKDDDGFPVGVQIFRVIPRPRTGEPPRISRKSSDAR